MAIRIRQFSGIELVQFIPEVARLRIEVFREFPYLYKGNHAYEEKYLRTYIDGPNSVVVIAFDGERVIGASTAIPLVHETEQVQRPFIENNISPESVFYLGESVLQKDYRGQGIGVQFFTEREAHAKSIGDFHWSAFCGVERPKHHPRKPEKYIPLDEFWHHRGYVKQDRLKTTFLWQDLDESAETPKPMTFWLKAMKPIFPADN